MMGPLLLAHRAVVGAGQQGVGAVVHPAGRADLRPAAGRCGLDGAAEALGVDLVEPCGEPLGEAAGVREHDRSSGAQDQVDDLLLDVRPDGPGLRRRRVESVEPGSATPSSVMSSTGTTTVQIEGLRRGRRHDPDRRGARRGTAPTSSCGRTVADSPMRWAGSVSSCVEPFEREREVRAALGAGDRVDLVDDDRVDAAQRLARRRREHQEQRLGGGDEDVRRGARSARGARRRGCRRSGPHADLRRGQAEPLRGLA